MITGVRKYRSEVEAVGATLPRLSALFEQEGVETRI
jgi:hypothetical protein